MAKKSNLMQAVEADLLTHLRSGLTIKDSCALVGITDNTYQSWRRRNAQFAQEVARARTEARRASINVLRRALEPTETSTETAEIFRETRVRKGVSEDGKSIEIPYVYERTMTSRRVTINPPDNQVAEWLLERSDPENWGRRDKITIEGGVEITLVNAMIRALQQAEIDPAATINAIIAEAARAQSEQHSSESHPDGAAADG